ncbi:hypothetical protein EG328_010026 [Venturia inaequalis]|uniref:Uncharacterized protein n=1 Tax=Venturia inaequalis TaxID=5025 RepID=A0A8H3VAF9_VENIN|nr:hypothetical protein EG327_007758 [Venturia inaequalis]KAE9983389.1 hypothetical protein EG328_010026 [Venturia inaequalis]
MSIASNTSSLTDCLSSTGLDDEKNEGERARCREMAAYLSAASIGVDTPHGPPSSPCASKDITLQALVQLGALRLDTDRAFLSLIDGESQYIVAEATRHRSLLPNKVTEGEPPLFLGVCKLDKTFGVCPNTIRCFLDETGKYVRDGPNVICNRTRYVINDFRAEPTYLQKPYVADYPHMVSYLEVPLMSPLGYCLGSYCIVDNRKRDFNNDKTVDTMNEISTAIMGHLDLVKLKEHGARSQKLMMGLGQIANRDSSAADLSVSRSITGSADSTHRASVAGSGMGSLVGTSYGSYGSAELDYLDQSGLTPLSEYNSMDQNDIAPMSGRRWQESAYSQISQMTTPSDTSFSGESTFSIPGPGTPPISPSEADDKDFCESLPATPEVVQNLNNELATPDDLSIPPWSRERHASDRDRPPPFPHSSATSNVTTTSIHASPVSLDVRETLSRAAETIREAMDMDRVTFFDAVPSGFASRSAHPKSRKHPLSFDDLSYIAEKNQQVCCATLSESVKDNQGAASPAWKISEAMLQRLIERYPGGHIFTADSFGPIDCRYGPGHAMRNIPKHTQDRTSRHRADIRKLFSLVPDARYIVMLPFWHFQKEVWFSVMFGVVDNPDFALDAADLNLLTSFGHSTMVEVSRCEALAVSRAKSDFISSLSHEIRSPLHGIMASGELLREAIDDPQHLPLLDMINSCSTTLLETFNNLLDFAKINTTVGAKGIDELGLAGRLRPELPLIDLSDLVEETVEQVQLGHYSKHGFHGRQGSVTTSMADMSSNSLSSTSPESLPVAHVLVTVKVEKRATWMTRIDTGAWKRIIMNMFGNALKYTRSGHIEVCLSMLQKPDSESSQTRTHICFSVKDTGIGMSPDYIKYHLYTPFSQENALSPGTGLGLSIVRQITKDLGGTVDVRSLLGIGTQVSVFFPLGSEQSEPPPLQLAPDVEGLPMDPRRELVGRTLCCITLEAYRTLSGLKRKTDSEARARGRVIKSTMKQIAKDHLGMNVIFATKGTAIPTADIYFFDSNICLTHGQIINTRSGMELPKCLFVATPMVMLCSGSGPLRFSREEQESSRVVHLRHPLGPRKLAAALIRALEIGTANPPPVTLPLVLETVAQDFSYFPGPLDEKSPLVTVQEIPVSNSALSPSLPAPSLVSTPMPLSPLPSSTDQRLSELSTEPHTLHESALHVLLVDDNPINLTILTTVVKKLKYKFATACNGLEAVHLFNASLHPSKRLFDVIFMDISMPVMDGLEATREIRQIEKDNCMGITSPAGSAEEEDTTNPQSSACQIIALTGLGSESSRQEAFSSGVNLFLTKPVKMGEIKSVLSSVEERVKSNVELLEQEQRYHSGFFQDGFS